MTATDELRRMLDERGVEWMDDSYGQLWSTVWHGSDGKQWRMNENRSGMLTELRAWNPTPEQAIEATLGRGTCKLHDCDGSFSSVNRPVWRCDCGAFMTEYTDATTYHKPRYCPNCGRRCVG